MQLQQEPSNVIKDAQGAYNLLLDKKQKGLEGLSEVEIPQVNPEESLHDYLARIAQIEALKPYILTKAELTNLVPAANLQNDHNAWEGKLQRLKEIKDKLSSKKLLLVESLQGEEVHARLELTPTEEILFRSGPIKEAPRDLGLCKAIAEQIDNGPLAEHEELKKVFTELVAKKLELFTTDMRLLGPALQKEIEQIEDNQLLLQGLEALKEIPSTDWEKAIRVQDQQALGVVKSPEPKLGGKNNDPNLDQDTDTFGVSAFTPEIELEDKKKGVVIFTSSGGSCHTGITQRTAKSLKDEGIPYVVINESQLVAQDPLFRMCGISESALYPIVFQQANQSDCRSELQLINRYLNRNFAPKEMFAQTRDLMAKYSQEMDIAAVYGTEHERGDLVFVPDGAPAYFQVCDFGSSGKLDDFVHEVDELNESVPGDYNVYFFEPSDSCIPQHEENLENLPKHILRTKYPVKKLSEEESQVNFAKFIDEQNSKIYKKEKLVEGVVPPIQQLYPPEDEDVARCAIVMGGQGGPLVEAYVQQILQELKEMEPPYPKMEFVFGCGKNGELRDELENKFQEHFEAFLPNVRVKFCGFIPNEQLIAYQKHGCLVTKPGGGTISECVMNNIRTCVHYDAKAWWEEGNAIEIERVKLGVRVGETDKSGEKHELNPGLIGNIQEQNGLARAARELTKLEEEEKMLKSNGENRCEMLLGLLKKDENLKDLLPTKPKKEILLFSPQISHLNKTPLENAMEKLEKMKMPLTSEDIQALDGLHEELERVHRSDENTGKIELLQEVIREIKFNDILLKEVITNKDKLSKVLERPQEQVLETPEQVIKGKLKM